VSDQPVPSEIVALAEERSRARAARDWPAADELRGQIEAAGWRVVDDDLAFSLRPAQLPDIVEDERTIFGSPEAVPSRLDEPTATGAAPDVGSATVVLLVDDPAGLIAPQLEALGHHLPVGTPLVVVAPREVEATELGLASDIVWTAEPWPAGAALRAALRRVASGTVTVLGQGLVPVADIVTPLAAALIDETVAIVGSGGMLSADLWHDEPGTPGEVTFVTADCYAFRRPDLLERGQVDDRLRSPAGLAMWLSLALRDGGDGVPHRRALAMPLPLQPPSLPPQLSSTAAAPDRERRQLERRDRYRVARRFRHRSDLLHAQPAASTAGGWDRSRP
jgi:hypothetical protein